MLELCALFKVDGYYAHPANVTGIFYKKQMLWFRLTHEGKWQSIAYRPDRRLARYCPLDPLLALQQAKNKMYVFK